MISKNDILNFVKHVHRRGRGIPDRRPMHPRREWFIGLSVALITVVIGAIVSVRTFEVYKNIDQRTYTVDIVIPSYNQTVVKRVLEDYAKRQSEYLILTDRVGVDSVDSIDAPSLIGLIWQWQTTLHTGSDTDEPAGPTDFSIIFNEDGKFTGTTDCNNLFGDYKLDGEILSIGPIDSTKKFCGTDTQEALFTEQLSQAASFVIEEDALQINLYKDAGVMMFGVGE